MNEKLSRYYRSAIGKGVWIVTFCGVFIALTAERLSGIIGRDNIAIDLLRSLLSMAVVATVFLFFEKQVRTRLWKHAYPELDVSGNWTGETTYQIQQIPEEGKKPEDYEPETVDHRIEFDQTCLTLKVKPTLVKDYPGAWYSLVAGFEGNELRYAYQVNYGNAPNRPESATGYEQLQLMGTEDGKSPAQLTGTFCHCAWGQRPVYSGTVTFRRQPPREDRRGVFSRTWTICVGLFAKFLKPRVD